MFDSNAEQIFSKVFNRKPQTPEERGFLTGVASRKSGTALQGALQYQQQHGGAPGSLSPASTNPQQNVPPQANLAGAFDQIEKGSQVVQRAFANVNQREQQIQAAQQKLITEQEQFKIRQTILQDPDYQSFLKFKAQLNAGVQNTDTSVDIKPGITDPANAARLSADQRAELASRASLLGSTLSSREQLVGQEVGNIAKLRQQQADIAQQNFQNSRLGLSDALAYAGEERNQQLFPGQLESQNLGNEKLKQEVSGTTPLNQAQRADLTAKLVNEGYTLDDATQVAQTYGQGGARTDRHNNPAAFTTDIAKQAGLVLGKDYTIGDPFPGNPNMRTALLLGDPYEQTIKVIDKIGFSTQGGATRWTYTNSIPGANNKDWSTLSHDQKVQVIQQMYQHEGGSGALDPATVEQRRQENIAVKAKEKPPTVSEQTTSTYAARLEQSNRVFNSLEPYTSKLNPATTFIQEKLPGFANTLKSNNFQSLEQAERNFLNAVLRRESGAVISPSEFTEGKRQYFPQPGDSKDVLEQKKANRTLVMNSFIKNSGNAYTPLDELVGGTSGVSSGTSSTSFDSYAKSLGY